MKIRQVIENCAVTFTQKYGNRLGTGQRKALVAMLACRRHYGEFTCTVTAAGGRNTLPLSIIRPPQLPIMPTSPRAIVVGAAETKVIARRVLYGDLYLAE